jgi:hypothetical protein
MNGTISRPYRNGLASQSSQRAISVETNDLQQSPACLARIEAIRIEDLQNQLPFDVRIYFVEVKQRQTNKAPEVLLTAYEMAKDMRCNVRLLPIEQLDEIIAQPGEHVLVLGSLTDDLYRKLLGQPSLRLFGPACIDYCDLSKNRWLPIRSIPPYNLCMRHTFVTCADLSATESNRLLRFVQLMGGHVSIPFRNCTTHVIAHSQLSPKCELARRHSVPIMTVDWIVHIWQRSMMNPIDALSRDSYQYGRLPIFAGLQICASQVNLSSIPSFIV